MRLKRGGRGRSGGRGALNYAGCVTNGEGHTKGERRGGVRQETATRATVGCLGLPRPRWKGRCHHDVRSEPGVQLVWCYPADSGYRAGRLPVPGPGWCSHPPWQAPTTCLRSSGVQKRAVAQTRQRRRRPRARSPPPRRPLRASPPPAASGPQSAGGSQPRHAEAAAARWARSRAARRPASRGRRCGERRGRRSLLLRRRQHGGAPLARGTRRGA